MNSKIQRRQAVALRPAATQVQLPPPQPTLPPPPGSVLPVTTHGACIIRDRYTDLPRYYDPDLGRGYAKMSKSDVVSPQGIFMECTQNDYETVMQSYCTQNKDKAHAEYALYDKNGLYTFAGCGHLQCEEKTGDCISLGCQLRSC